ncbi:MAG: putative bifunctional diguanylate cyclase/phosphodiesterase [Hyphomicrobiales bacterium]
MSEGAEGAYAAGACDPSEEVSAVPRPPACVDEAPPRMRGIAAATVPGAAPFDVLRVLSAAGESCYIWSITSDDMVWTGNALDILRSPSPEDLKRGRSYQLLLDPEFAEKRYLTLLEAAGKDTGEGAPYWVQYRFKPKGRRSKDSLWIEDTGRCFAGPGGRPDRAWGVVRVINERYEREQKLLFLSAHDELTGHMNRNSLTEALSSYLETSSEGRTFGAFLMAAVNNLGHVNDTYGFEVGDEVLRIVGQRLKSCLRGSDVIGRYGSNKFGLLLRDCGPDQFESIAERLVSSVSDSVVETSAGALATTVRLGAVLIPKQARTVNSVVCRSLEALEWARTKNPLGYRVFEPSEQRDNRRKRNVVLADQVLQALNERRMMLALQPIVARDSRRPAFYECLLRMRATDGSVISAGEFIPVAEQLGLAGLIDHRVLELAVKMLQGLPELRLSMNVSGETTGNKEWLEALAAATGGDRDVAGRLTIEITETVAIADIEESISFVRCLKELGCRVAIDDFGAGYSSFRNLRLLNVDLVKIDGSFVHNLAQSPEDRIFVETLTGLARNFGLETVAEWVADEATAAILSDLGVDYFQGFHFGAPRLVGGAAQARPRAEEAGGAAVAAAGTDC